MEGMENSIILDTSAVIDLFKNEKSKIIEEVRNNSPQEVLITSITKFELEVGAKTNEDKEKIGEIPCISFDCQSSTLAAKMFFELEKEGKRPGLKDCLIAAVAINTKSILITKDKDFRIFEKYGIEIRIV